MPILSLLVLAGLQAKVAVAPKPQVLILSAPMERDARAQALAVMSPRATVAKDRRVRRFETTLKRSGPVMLIVEEDLLPDARFEGLRPAFADLARNWRAGEPLDLAASENKGARGWLWNQLNPPERNRTSSFTLSTNKTMRLVGNGRSVEYELDTNPKLRDSQYEAGPLVMPKPESAESSTAPPVQRPPRERHLYHKDVPTFMDELEVQAEASEWLRQRWRDQRDAFAKEFASLFDALESDRQSRERMAEPKEGTAFDDLPPESQDILRKDFEFMWSRMGFPNAGAATSFLESSRIGPVRTDLHAIAGGIMANGTPYNYVQVIRLP